MSRIVTNMLLTAGHEIVVESHGFPPEFETSKFSTIDRNPKRWKISERGELFEKFDGIVNLPGGGLQSRDFRMECIDRDIRIASKLGIPYALSSHSICPLVNKSTICKVSLIIARENVTANFLEKLHLPYVASADYAWLTVMPKKETEYKTVLMLRWDGKFSLDRIYWDGRCLRIMNRAIPILGQLIVSTSDPLKDRTMGLALSHKLGVEWKPCRTEVELIDVISSASQIITDRYHPAILATLAGVECHFVGGVGVRNDGLRTFLTIEPEYLRTKAKIGLEKLKDWCENLKRLEGISLD
jgi:polysaccharide pyruvyl transferase WcaK-like protein